MRAKPFVRSSDTRLKSPKLQSSVFIFIVVEPRRRSTNKLHFIVGMKLRPHSLPKHCILQKASLALSINGRKVAETVF